jgi:hypothetical protein
LFEVWNRPVAEKLHTGWSQRFLRLERAEDPATLWAYTDEVGSKDGRCIRGLVACYLGVASSPCRGVRR